MIGDLNPLPYQCGGGPSRTEAAYHALKRLVGVNGSSFGDDSIEATWRIAKATALVTLESFDERATLQNWPQTTTDHIELWEEFLSITANVSLSHEDRRQAIRNAYTIIPQSWFSALNEQLILIDPRFSVALLPWVNAGTTHMGRAFESYDPIPGEEYVTGFSNPRISTAFAAASSKHTVFVLFNLGATVVPTRQNFQAITDAEALLQSIIPAWKDYSIYHGIGFTLDQDLLDITAFGI